MDLKWPIFSISVPQGRHRFGMIKVPQVRATPIKGSTEFHTPQLLVMVHSFVDPINYIPIVVGTIVVASDISMPKWYHTQCKYSIWPSIAIYCNVYPFIFLGDLAHQSTYQVVYQSLNLSVAIFCCANRTPPLRSALEFADFRAGVRPQTWQCLYIFMHVDGMM